jgi:PIN domain nuclease of toxin-antitoxin system
LSIFDKKRVSFDFKKLFKKIHESENFAIIPLDFPVLQKMISLRELPELHDKIIVSTAKYLSLPLITKDEIIRGYSDIKTIW